MTAKPATHYAPVSTQAGTLLRALRTLLTPQSVAVLTGLTGAGAATIVVAGPEPWASFLADQAFLQPPHRRLLATSPAWLVPRVLRDRGAEADLTTARLDRLVARWLFREPHLAVPEWINMTTILPADLNQWRRGRHGKALDNDLRHVQRSALSSKMASRDEDLTDFYQSYYLPHVSNRFAERAHPRRIEELRRLARCGGLLWVSEGGRRVLGTVFYRRGQVLHSVASAPLNGERCYLEHGAHALAFWRLMEYAQQSGCTQVSLGATRAILTDGPLRFKRKFHGGFVDQPDLWYDFVVIWNHLRPGVHGLLQRAPLVWRHGSRFSAVASVPAGALAHPDELTRHGRYLRTGGLQQLYLMSPSPMLSDTQPHGDFTLLGTDVASHSDPEAWAAYAHRDTLFAGAGSIQPSPSGESSA
jgi:hypothetical protein